MCPLTTYVVSTLEEVNLLTRESAEQKIEAEKKPMIALDKPNFSLKTKTDTECDGE